MNYGLLLTIITGIILGLSLDRLLVQVTRWIMTIKQSGIFWWWNWQLYMRLDWFGKPGRTKRILDLRSANLKRAMQEDLERELQDPMNYRRKY